MKIKVKVIPNAKKERVVDEHKLLKVYVNAPPVEGKANKRLLEILAEYFKVKKGEITVVRGQTSREKLIEIDENR